MKISAGCSVVNQSGWTYLAKPSSAPITAVGQYAYAIYPGIAAAGAGLTQVAGYPLTRIWKVTMAHADADPITYSVGAAMIL